MGLIEASRSLHSNFSKNGFPSWLVTIGVRENYESDAIILYVTDLCKGWEFSNSLNNKYEDFLLKIKHIGDVLPYRS